MGNLHSPKSQGLYTQAASVALIENGRICLIRRAQNPYKGRWTLPGGKIEQDETPEQCALREMREELNVELAHLKFVTRFTVGSHALDVFTTTHYSGTLAPNAEVAEMAWVTPSQLDNLFVTPQLGSVVALAFSTLGLDAALA